MKAKALTVRECTWTSEECHLVEELHGDSQTDRLCLPNIFRTKKVKPLTRVQIGLAYHVYHTARELLLEVLDREVIQELTRRGAGGKAGASRPSYSQIREQSKDVSEEVYADMLTWFSVVLQSGLSVGENGCFGAELTLKLDGWQGVLKRNSFQTSLLSLTRLEDGDKQEVLSALSRHFTRRYQALYTPGQNLAVKKYRLSYQQAPCPLHLALLCDLSSGFICNMFFYCPELLHRGSRKPVVAQVVGHLLRPFNSLQHLVQLDSSAWMEGKLNHFFSHLGINVQFVPTVGSESSPPVMPKHQRVSGDSPSQLTAHLQGWTGPALFPVSDLKGSGVDMFTPGFWTTLHMICINTFVLHTLQSSGRHIRLMEFTRSLTSQMAMENSLSAPALPQLGSSSYRETSLTKHRSVLTLRSPGRLGKTLLLRDLSQAERNAHSSSQGDTDCQGFSSVVRLQAWDRPGVCGLDNSGNSCYFNAVLQCFCSTVPLVEHLLNQNTRKQLSRSKCQLAQVLVRLLEEMWLGRSSSCAPVEARSVLCSLLPQFNNHSQQDAQELLLFLLNVLHDDLKKVGRRHAHLSKPQERNCAAVGEPTIISRLFEGQLDSTTICMHCDHQAHSRQSFTVLSLPIPADIIKCSIHDCLSLFFDQTILTGGEQMLCPVCGLRRETAVLTCLDKPPEILTLHLKRFGCKGRSQVKLKTRVAFPMKLDLTPFLSSPAQESSFSSYRLYAVVNHAGHLNMGHYTALCRSTLTQTWHCFDDSAVNEVPDELVQSPDAYILLYSRKHFQKPKLLGL